MRAVTSARRCALAALFVSLSFVGTSTDARADESDPPEAAPAVELRHSWAADSIATGVMAVTLVTWSAARSSNTSLSCTICDGDGADDVNDVDDVFRNAFRRRDGSAAETASKVMVYGVAPAATLALTMGVAAADHRLAEAPLDALLVAEGTLAGMVANETLGAIVLRERPSVHVLGADDRAVAIRSADALRSFPSGFSGTVMAMTAAAGTVASLRRYRLAPLVWIVGTTLALTTSYLRIAADRSYATDELTGAAVGLAFGAGVPLLFHRRVGQKDGAAERALGRAVVTSSAVPGGRVVGLAWAF